MSSTLQVLTQHSPTKLQEVFARDIQEGLLAKPKRISSAYFYDEIGSRIFQEIMDMPAYYPSNCETEALQSHKNEIVKFLDGRSFRLVELGAGDGRKTQILLDHFCKCNLDFEYVPIDISHSAMKQLIRDIRTNFSDVPTTGMVCAYEEGLHTLNQDDTLNLVLFLGSSIGNFSYDQAVHFCRQIHSLLSPEDMMLLGFDLVKDPDILLRAYKDHDGVTTRFNLNLLHRINRELGANFNADLFQHHASYDPAQKTMKSYLISCVDQSVYIKTLNRTFHFETWEPIHTEYSWKYTLQDTHDLAQQSNFDVLDCFTDSRKYFLNILWRVS